jgi:hypothetical protein
MTDPATTSLAGALPRMRDRWLGGANAATVAPPEWVSKADDNDGLRLLALAGQALSVLRAPAPAGELTLRPPLQQLESPFLLDGRCVLLRRALAMPGLQAGPRLDIIRLLAARGFAVHPEDWRRDIAELADIELYLPWAAWAEGSTPQRGLAAPTPENWSDWTWPERLAAFTQMRGKDPAAARELLASILAAETADHRLRLVAGLAQGLGNDDIPFIEGLSADRSDKVKAQAQRMLARLGAVSTDTDSGAELRDFLELRHAGLLKRKPQVVLRELKTPAQWNRASQLLSQLSLGVIAGAFGLSEQDIVWAWRPAPSMLDAAFVQAVATTGSDAAHEALVRRSVESFPFPAPLLATFADAARPDQRRTLVGCVLSQDVSAQAALQVAGTDPGWAPSSVIRSAPVWTAIEAIATSTEDNTATGRAMESNLLALGLLCDAQAARSILDMLERTGGRWASNPASDLLKLNAALTETPAP